MSLNIDMKIIRPWQLFGFAHFAHELLDFTDKLQCSESWENIPLEFHRLTINCVQGSVLWWIFEPSQLSLPNSIWCWVLTHLSRHNTESENTWTFACERLMTSSSLTRDNCFHGELSQLIWDTPKISSDCSNINCSDISNICFKVIFSPVFLMGCKQIVWVILSHGYRCFRCRKT